MPWNGDDAVMFIVVDHGEAERRMLPGIYDRISWLTMWAASDICVFCHNVDSGCEVLYNVVAVIALIAIYWFHIH